MKHTVNILRVAALLAVILAAGWLAYRWTHSPEPSRLTMRDATIADISPMVRLCALDIHEDVPVRGDIGPKHLFGRATVNGSVTFDLEDIHTETRGDSLIVTLPRERVEIYESTDKGSYEVIDTWNDRLFGSATFTAAEENRIKALVRDNFRRKVYAKGYVRRARAEAVANLSSMLSSVTGKTVVVNDPTPDGTL